MRSPPPEYVKPQWNTAIRRGPPARTRRRPPTSKKLNKPRTRPLPAVIAWYRTIAPAATAVGRPRPPCRTSEPATSRFPRYPEPAATAQLSSSAEDADSAFEGHTDHPTAAQ